MTTFSDTPVLHSAARRERGVVMFVALVVLIVMTLAGLAMLRQMGGGVSIAGNLAFKQSATAVADAGIEQARVFVTTNAAPDFDAPTLGYYSSWGSGAVDPQSADWATWWDAVSSARDIVDAQTGNTVRYVMHRLCQTPGIASDDDTQRCSDAADSNSGGSKGGTSYGGTAPKPKAQPYFRVTARVTGPRNTVSYTQIVMQ